MIPATLTVRSLVGEVEHGSYLFAEKCLCILALGATSQGPAEI